MIPVYQSYQTASSGDGAPVITKPTSTVAGDLLIAHLTCVSGAAGSTWNTPSGWTLLDQTGTDPVSAIFYKIAGGSEPADYTFTMTTVTNRRAMGTIVRVTGNDATNPININAAGTSPIATQSPSGNNLVFIFSTDTNADRQSGYALATDNPTWTEAYDFDMPTFGSGAMSMAYGDRIPSGATGNISVTDATGVRIHFISVNPIITSNFFYLR